MRLLPESRSGHQEDGPEEERRRLRQRVRSIARRHARMLEFRRACRRVCRRARLPVLAGLAAIGCYAASTDRGTWPPAALNHGPAYRNCDAVRAAGLAPARRGQPGYSPLLDADGDGIACEPWLDRDWRPWERRPG